LNTLGQIAGISSTEFGLANMILAAANIGTVSSISRLKLEPYLRR
jgi:hypothetical protein